MNEELALLSFCEYMFRILYHKATRHILWCTKRVPALLNHCGSWRGGGLRKDNQVSRTANITSPAWNPEHNKVLYKVCSGWAEWKVFWLCCFEGDRQVESHLQQYLRCTDNCIHITQLWPRPECASLRAVPAGWRFFCVYPAEPHRLAETSFFHIHQWMCHFVTEYSCPGIS